MRFVFLVCLTGFAVSGHSQVNILPSDSDIIYTGRVDFDNPEAPSFSMNGVSINATFNGTNMSARFSSKGKSYLYIIVDGNDDPLDRTVIEVNSATTVLFDLTGILESGEHSVEIVKLSEHDSKTTFHGFDILGAGLSNVPTRPPLKLEFYGDSNTSGWNAWNAFDNGGSEASGAYYTFPGIASRMLNAEYSLIGVGGAGITNNTWLNLSSSYDLIHIDEDRSDSNTWNFEDNYWNFEPDAVIINLGANDLYGSASKSAIKSGWKSFIKDKLRLKYPNAHIVLANSYGWVYGEPADYVHEAIEELITENEHNVSFVRFPWLWGQTHAVVNEHAGFANILASHLAKKLDIDVPEPSPLASFAEKNNISNGSFETTTLPGFADGWRPHGTVQVVTNEAEALHDKNYLEVRNNGWVNFATEVDQGTRLNLSVWSKSALNGQKGKIKIEFKDQAQKTITSVQRDTDLNPNWELVTTAINVPENAWSAWIILQAEPSTTISYDNATITSSIVLGAKSDSQDSFDFFPNPAKGVLHLVTKSKDYLVQIASMQGKIMHSQMGYNEIDVGNWSSGVYILQVPSLNFSRVFVHN